MNRTIIEKKDLSTVSIDYDTVNNNSHNKENTTAIEMDSDLENDKREKSENTIIGYYYLTGILVLYTVRLP